jgi:phospholipase C
MRWLKVWIVVLLVSCGKPKPVVTEAMAAAARAACTYGPGALAAETLASDAPTGRNIPIDHVVLIIQENHSFDSVFSHLGGDVMAAADNATNPGPDGTPVARSHQPHLCSADPDHSWRGSHEEWDNGLNDGFAKVNGGIGATSLQYWDGSDIPYYYALAHAFTVSDSHHASVLGPTVPNRMFSLAGTSYGLTYNAIAPATDAAGKPYPNVFTELDAARVDWKYYSDSSPPESGALLATYLNDGSHYFPLADFAKDAAAGTLPSFSIAEPRSTSYADTLDEHPPGDIQNGEQAIAAIVNALLSSPNWGTSALFLSYDENGGFYDSVPPPPACIPDDLPVIYSQGDPPGAFDRYGFRVPLIVVSPYAKRGYVTHHVTDHTSVLRFVEARFGLPAITKRDANADPLFDAFDFTHPDKTVPTLPTAPLDPGELSYCETAWPDPSP